MMVHNIGVDISKIDRFDINHKLINRIVSPIEKKELHSLKAEQQRLFLASRWVLKEAIFKATNEMIPFDKMTIEKDKSGKPIYKSKKFKVFLSLSHESDIVIGFAVAYKK